PNHAIAYSNLGTVLHQQGKLDEAITFHRQAIRLDPNYSTAYYNLGTALSAQGKLDEAITSYQQAIRLNPNDAITYNNLGNALIDQGKLDEAIANYQQVIRLDPNHAIAYSNLGTVLHQQGKLDEAITFHRQAIRLDPNYSTAYYNLGTALSAQGKLDEAITSYQQAIRLNPNDAITYNNLGIALSAQGKLDEAITSYQQAIRLNPNDAIAYNNLGAVLRQQGKLDEAITSYQQAIRLDPNYSAAYNNLGNALSTQGKLDEAIANHRKALSLPDRKGSTASAHTLAHNGLGYALQQQGRLLRQQGKLEAAIAKIEDAIAEYELSIALDNNFVTAQNNLREAKRLAILWSNLQPVTASFQPIVIDDWKHLPSEEEEPLVNVLRSTARIIAEVSEGSFIGTGWVVKRQGNTLWIVTNRHVISDRQSKRPSDKIEVEFFSELPDEKRPRYDAMIEEMTDANDLKLDLAVLKVTGIPDDIQPLKFRAGRVRRNTPVRVIGHPFNVDEPWNSASGEVTNYYQDSPMLPIDANVAEGNSGGPVINKQMEVIAVMVRIRNNRDLALDLNQPSPNISQFSEATGGIGLAYRIDIVLDKLRQWRILN
ncbi:MAG: tetratricopeptide repeat protein, partial [Symploca sp. SIO2B6]|nr:tetratricopeptide repeat protein [Symploca sp. SIO2B6]